MLIPFSLDLAKFKTDGTTSLVNVRFFDRNRRSLLFADDTAYSGTLALGATEKSIKTLWEETSGKDYSAMPVVSANVCVCDVSGSAATLLIGDSPDDFMTIPSGTKMVIGTSQLAIDIEAGTGSGDGSASYTRAFDITPNDATDLAITADELRIGSAGNVKITTSAGDTVTVPNVAAGDFITCGVTRVWATGTTATGITGFVGA